VAYQRALGRILDIGTAFAPVDLNTAGATGKRVSLSHATGCLFVAYLGVAASGVEDVVFTVQQHTAYTGGTTSSLSTAAVATSTGITAWHMKAEALLDNDEPWIETTQADGATVTVTGATYSLFQCIVAIPISAEQLGDGYTHVSVNVADPGSASRLGGGLYLLHDLDVQRKPTNLLNLLRPGAANA
jgi:hypothetical protein